jgi:carbon-monoxide dehydrogenase small subunit
VTSRPVRLVVNGVERTAYVEPRRTLADTLRDDLELTGTHLGCEHGVCGACTVLVDGASARACLMLTVQADGRDITTVEGLERDGELHPVQQGCWERHSFQCGFCTPGFLLAAVELLAEQPEPSEDEIRAALSGNLCRCTGYESIIAGVARAAELIRAKEAS